MDLYELKKTIESVYYTHCIKQGKLPLPDLIYYHWDKKRISKSLNSLVDRGHQEKNVRKQRKITKKRKEKEKET